MEEVYREAGGKLDTKEGKQLFEQAFDLKKQQSKQYSKIACQVLVNADYLEIQIDTASNSEQNTATVKYIQKMCLSLHKAAIAGSNAKDAEVFDALKEMDKAEDDFGTALNTFVTKNIPSLITSEDEYTERMKKQPQMLGDINKADSTSIYKLRILLDKEEYFPQIYQAFAMRRCLVQWCYFAPGPMAPVPQEEYNAMRMKCANITLKYIANHPDDALARNAFLTLATSPNFKRRGTYGNQVFEDMHEYFPDAIVSEHGAAEE